MNIQFRSANKQFERWLQDQTPVVQSDLKFRHDQIRKDEFVFLRATCFRFVQTWLELFPDITSIPRVPSVGDAHLENFGTWRAASKELMWGINDFDEAALLPYTFDLVRLATSVVLAHQNNLLNLEPTEACEAIVDGYRTALESGGEPFRRDDPKLRWLKQLMRQARKSEAAFQLDLERQGQPESRSPNQPLRQCVKPSQSSSRSRFVRVLGRGCVIAVAAEREQSSNDKRILMINAKNGQLMAQQPIYKFSLGREVFVLSPDGTMIGNSLLLLRISEGIPKRIAQVSVQTTTVNSNRAPARAIGFWCICLDSNRAVNED